MLWIERVLTGYLAFLCELFGLDSDRLAMHQRKKISPPSQGRTQTVYRLR